MGQAGSPSPVQGPVSTPIVDRAWKKKGTIKEARHSFSAVVIGLFVSTVLYIDMHAGLFGYMFSVSPSIIWYCECGMLIVLLLSIVKDVWQFVSQFVFSRPVEITKIQKQLLGVADNDPGFMLSPVKPASPSGSGADQSLVFSSSTPSSSSHTAYSPGSTWSSLSHATPTNLGPAASHSHSFGAPSPGNSFLSQSAGHLSFDRSGSVPTGPASPYSANSSLSHHSLAYSPGASLSSLDGSGLRSRFSLSSSFRSPSPSDKMTDLQSLSMYLKEQDEKEYKSSICSQDLSMNSPSFWSYGRPSMDYSHLMRKNKYQLASRSPQSHKSRSDDNNSMGEEVWRPLGVTDDDLFLWFERLRKWLGNTIMVQLSKEITNINSQLRKIGSEDTEIGEVGVSTLKQLALTKGGFVPTLNVMVPYLDFHANQEYLVKRIKDLGSDGCISEFTWNRGGSGSHYGKQWEENLPTDAELVMHMFCTYMDARLPPDLRYPDGTPFTSQHFLKAPDKPNLEKDNLLLYQTTINPPHFQVIIKDMIYNLPKGRNNMFHALLFFLYHVKNKANGMLGRVNLGMSGVNILSVLDS